MNDLYIKEIRQKLSISQKKLAEMIGVSEKTIQNWESGTKIPASKHAILRALLLDPKAKTITTLKNNTPSLSGDSNKEERLLSIIDSQQRTIEHLSETINRLTKN